MKYPLISIIVPVYNVEQFLPMCIDSLLAQSYPYLEILAVNDGSQDQSAEILKEYAQKDRRLKFFNKKNSGVSDTRNFALAQAKGDYVMFVDADDWLDNSTLEECINAIKDADVCFFPYIREFLNHSLLKQLFDKNYTFNAEECQELQRRMIGPIGKELAHPEMLDSLGTIWGKLYRKEVLNGIKFIDLKIIGTAEDTLYNCMVFRNVKKAVYLNTPFYHYRKFNIQAETKRYKPNLPQQWNQLFNYIGSTILNKEGEQALSNRIALSIIGLGLNECLAAHSFQEKKHRINKIIIQPHYTEAYHILNLSYFPFHWKLFFYAAKHRINNLLILLLLCIKKIIS